MNRIKELADRMGISQKELAISIGVSQPTVSDWCNGRKNPKGENLDKVSAYFGVTKSVILGYDDKIPDFPPPFLKSFIPIKRSEVPIIGEIACGTPIDAQENVEGYADIPEGVVADFALRCKGNSMEPTLVDGDLVLIKKQEDVEEGQIAAVLIDGSATLKRVYHDENGFMLIADNPRYSPIRLSESGCEYAIIQGRAIGYMRSF